MEVKQKKLLWIDCDPGHDDMVALVIAIMDRENSELIGLTVSAGNTSLENTERNAFKILKFFGLDEKVPVFLGSEKRYDGKEYFCDNFHGISGMDGVNLDESGQRGERDNIYEKMYEIFRKQNQKVNLIVTGPMTNVCYLFHQKPEIKQYVELLSIMGGGIDLFNVTESAEFNFYSDPLAADLALKSGVKIFLAPLDLTHTVLFSQEHLDLAEQKSSTNKLAKLIHESMTFYLKKYSMRFKNQGPMHDPLAVYYALHPENFETKFLNVVVEHSSEFNNGRSIVDLYQRTPRTPNVHVGLKTDPQKFFDYLFSLIDRFPLYYQQ